MKTLMKKIGGCKKARYWNMARFQTRRWHREHAEPAAATNEEPKTANLATATHELTNAATAIPSPGGEGWCPSGRTEGGLSPSSCPPLIQKSTNPTIQPPVHPPIQPLTAPPLSVPSVKSVVDPSSQLPPPHSHTRTGKIARLPHEMRETVNNMLRGGLRHIDIADHLEKAGHPGITTTNISFWRQHGYIEWLDRQHELETRATLIKSYEHCTRSIDIDRVQQNAILFAAQQLSNVMAQFDHHHILNLLAERPELFPKFVTAMATLTRCSHDLARAFTVNQKSDTIIRDERNKNPNSLIAQPLSDEDEPAEPAKTSTPVTHAPTTPAHESTGAQPVATTPVQVNLSKSNQNKPAPPPIPPSSSGQPGPNPPPKLPLQPLSSGESIGSSNGAAKPSPLASTANNPPAPVNNLSISNTVKIDSRT